VPFHLAFTLRDLGERPNAARYEIVDSGRHIWEFAVLTVEAPDESNRLELKIPNLPIVCPELE
jgi:hypothetical protein